MREERGNASAWRVQLVLSGGRIQASYGLAMTQPSSQVLLGGLSALQDDTSWGTGYSRALEHGLAPLPPMVKFLGTAGTNFLWDQFQWQSVPRGRCPLIFDQPISEGYGCPGAHGTEHRIRLQHEMTKVRF